MPDWSTMEALRQLQDWSLAWWALQLLDIFLLAFLIYHLLRLVRGTRAVHMFLGIVYLVLLYWITGLVGLETLHRVMGTVFPFLGFAMVVIFQNTIRRALALFGGILPLRQIYTAQPARVVDDVVLAARSLAQRKIGALIVLARDQGLKHYIETGIQMDAALSYDLLVNIFMPKTPLHDGAVIIDEGRIVAASCFLPLTAHPSLSKAFGTRHRAAIGMTEETDALTVVVSEERGEVSAAFEGRIHRDLDDDGLRTLLRRNLKLRVEPAHEEEVEDGDGEDVEAQKVKAVSPEKVHES